MIYCVKCETARDACDEFDKFLEDNEICLETKLMIKKIIKHTPVPIIILDNGDEFHFISRYCYEWWCKGRTYTMLEKGETYHSGLPCKIEYTEVGND